MIMGLQSRMVRAALILAALAVSSVTSLAQTIVRPPVAGAPTPPVIAPSVIAPQLMPPVAAAPSPSMVPPHVLAPPRPTFGPAVDGVISPVAPVAPQVAQPAGRRVALVIGNSAYQNTTALANPANDATIMAQALRDVGFEVIDGVDLDRRGLDLKIRDFARALGTADAGLFYYAGHGLQVGGQNYLVPVDARLESERDLDFEAVKIDFVLRQMEIDREAKTNIVFLDACRDNPLSRNLARSMGTRSAGLGRGLAQVQTGVGTFISFSTQPGNVALDGEGKNSPFTTALVRHISTPGKTLNGVMIEVRKDVLAATGGRQVPWDHSALTGDFFFKGDVTLASAAGAATAGRPQTGPAADGSGEVAALQERMKALEEQLKQKGSATVGADAMRLAELRARAANLEDLTKQLQQKLFAARMDEGRATNANDKQRLQRDSMNIQMEWSRRGQDLKKLKDEMAALETSTMTTAAIALPANVANAANSARVAAFSPPPLARHPGGESLCEVKKVPGSLEAGEPLYDMVISNDGRDCATRIPGNWEIADSPRAGTVRISGQSVVYTARRGHVGEDGFAAVPRGPPPQATIRFRVQIVPGP